MALSFASASVAALDSRSAPGVTRKITANDVKGATPSSVVARRPRQNGAWLGGRQRLCVSAASVRVEFTPADGGETIVATVEESSVLREVALGSKVELYGGMAKLMNCGGNGQCGTCAVRVTEGAELLSERTAAEDGKLKGKPADWRLACQSLVGGADAPEGAVLKVTNKPKK